MRKRIVLIFILAITNVSANEQNEIKKEAKNAIVKMANTLKINMKERIKDGGIINALNFCVREANNIENNVNKTYNEGISVKRVTLKARNPKNIASSDEQKILKNLHKLQKEGKALPKMLVVNISNNHYKVYKPIFINDVCLKCHADVQKIDKKVYNLIKSSYDTDKAIGYKNGDLRGVFIADIIKKTKQ
jgi:hypothetical protein